jgi:site-specific recombinase XerD
MFEQLFKRPWAVARHRDGPLADERRRFLVHCADQRMALRSLRAIAAYTLRIANALRLTHRPGEFITPEEIKAAADRCLRRRPAPRCLAAGRTAWREFTRLATRWLSFLGRLQRLSTTPQPYAGQLSAFAEHLRQERGLSPCTIASYCSTASGLLAQLCEAGLRLDTLTIAQLDDVLVRQFHQGGYARRTVRRHVDSLRAFFRYAEAHGWCCQGLALALQAPRIYAQEGLPAGPSWEDVKRLLAATPDNRPADIRARAVLMLLAVYGLRATEVVGLSLEDFDWQHELLTVRRGKGQRPRIYPLCRAVGDAVLRYLREVRPRSDRREAFLLLCAPFGPMSRFIVGRLVRKRLRALDVTLPHYGPHSLRHACATHLLEQGLSLKEIGDHLGHQDPETTRLYAKVDLASLRAVGDFDLEGLL